MGRKAKRLRLLRRIENFKQTTARDTLSAENSVMQEKLKKERPEEAVEPKTAEIVEEMIKEVEELVQEVEVKPKPKRKRTTRTRKPRKKKTVE